MTTPSPNSPPRPSLWRRLRHAWAAFMGRKPRSGNTQVFNAYAELVDTAPSPLEPNVRANQRGVVPYNPQALPAAREQWQRGDWASLAALTLDELQDHPDRAKLALLAATGHFQAVDRGRVHMYLSQAKAWGIKEDQIKKILIATMYRTAESANLYAGKIPNSQLNNIKAQTIANIKGSNFK
jgi:hypothetical protein